MKVTLTSKQIDVIPETLGDLGGWFVERSAVKVKTRRPGAARYSITLPFVAWKSLHASLDDRLMGPNGGWLKAAPAYQKSMKSTIAIAIADRMRHPALHSRVVPCRFAAGVDPSPIPAWNQFEDWLAVFDFHSPEPPRVQVMPPGVSVRTLEDRFFALVPRIEERDIGKVWAWRPEPARVGVALSADDVDAALFEEATHQAFDLRA